MNKVILIGNVTKDPEIRATSNGVKRANFTLAVDRRFANAQGNREADFINIVAWREKAEFCETHVTKGKKLAIWGSIQTRSYDAQDGSRRSVVEVVADELEFVTPKGEQKAEQVVSHTAESELTPADNEEGLPF